MKKNVVHWYASDDQCKRDHRRHWLVDERIHHEPHHWADEDSRHDRISDDAIWPGHRRTGSAQPIDRRDTQRVEGPDGEHKRAGEPLEALAQDERDPEARWQQDRGVGRAVLWVDAGNSLEKQSIFGHREEDPRGREHAAVQRAEW